jgi:plasmid stabilization system protein ParE
MVYRVEVAQAAEAELEALYLWVVSRAPSQGAAWFNGLERAVLALNEHPERCPAVPAWSFANARRFGTSNHGSAPRLRAANHRHETEEDQ